jgi:hypothetical protein
MQSIMALTGGELESLAQVIEVCLMGLIPNEEQKCWELHINIIHLLQGNHFTDTKLMILTSKIAHWKAAMVKQYSNMMEKRSSSRIVENKSEMAKVSFRFPNFEMCKHWVELIQFLGPPEFQDTKLWEQQHLVAKCMCMCTNQCNITCNVLVKVHFYFLHKHCCEECSPTGQCQLLLPSITCACACSCRCMKRMLSFLAMRARIRLLLRRRWLPTWWFTPCSQQPSSMANDLLPSSWVSFMSWVSWGG